MSWSLGGHGENKTQTMKRFEEQVAACPVEYLPPALMECIRQLIEPMPEEQVISISTFGHKNPQQGAQITIRINI